MARRAADLRRRKEQEQEELRANLARARLEHERLLAAARAEAMAREWQRAEEERRREEEVRRREEEVRRREEARRQVELTFSFLATSCGIGCRDDSLTSNELWMSSR